MKKTNSRLILILTIIIAIMAYTAQSMPETIADYHQKRSLTEQHKNLRSHAFSASVSNQLSQSIKSKIISNLPTFSDQTFAQQLKQDLNQPNDSKRKLKQISVRSAQQLFKIFGLKGIVCDKNGDGIIIKEELHCLNYIWKYYVPQDAVQK